MDFSDQEAQARFLAAVSLKHGIKKLGGRVASRIRTDQEIIEVGALHAATKKILQSKIINLSRKQKKAIKFELVQNVSFSTAKELVGGADRTLRKWRALSQSDVDDMWDDDVEECSITADGESTKESEKVDCIILNMYAAFFVKHSGVLSGASRDRRTLAMPKHKLLSILFGEIPGMLRGLVVSHPDILQSISSKSRLRRSLEAAVAAAKQVGFDQGTEVSYRTAMAEAIYRKALDKKRAATSKILPGEVKVPREDHTFSGEQIVKAREIMPIGDRAFWDTLKRAKIKYTTNLKPTICALCDSGVLHVAAAKEITRKRLQNTATIGNLCAHAKAESREMNAAEKQTITECEKQLELLVEEKRKLDPLLNKYHMHEAQYAKCRQVVQKIEDDLEPGECLLYRDFVCQYCANGKKMSNLQLVCVYRNRKGGKLRQIQVSNFSLEESNDKYYVADVMDLHLREGGSGVLKNFKKITMTGDHGTHFSDIGTIYNESGMSEKYGKEVRIVSLCSYHCYNRCDAAGVHSKKIAKQAAKESKPLKSSRDYTLAVIGDNRTDTCAYDFTDINRSASVLGDATLRRPLPVVILREQCEIVYVFTGKDGTPMHTKGIIRCRPVPDEGQFVLVDLVCERQQRWCQRCTQHYQRPIEHIAPANIGESDTCELDVVSAQGDPIVDLHAKQDPKRISGLQFTKKVMASIKKGTSPTSIAIRLKCRHCKKTFVKAQGVNKHMVKFHPGVYDPVSEAFNEPPKCRKSKVKKKNGVEDALGDTVKQMKLPAGTEGVLGGDTGIAVAVLVGESAATISPTHASSGKTDNTPTNETLRGAKRKVPDGDQPGVITPAVAAALAPGGIEETTSPNNASVTMTLASVPLSASSVIPEFPGVRKRKRNGGGTPGELKRAKKRTIAAGTASIPGSVETPCRDGGAIATAATCLVGPGHRKRKMRRKKEHKIPYGPSSHRCNCAEYGGNFVHLPVAASSTPIAMMTAVWVVDFDEACRLRVLRAEVCSNVTGRSKYYECDTNKKAPGQLLRFDMGNPSAETWWYPLCDVSTTLTDAERRVHAIRNVNRRYKPGYLEHIDLLPVPAPPRTDPEL